jgi:hypothetical protein
MEIDGTMLKVKQGKTPTLLPELEGICGEVAALSS